MVLLSLCASRWLSSMACNYFAKKGWLTGPRGAATEVNLQDSEQCSAMENILIMPVSNSNANVSSYSCYSSAYFLLILFNKLSLIFVKEVKYFDVHQWKHWWIQDYRNPKMNIKTFKFRICTTVSFNFWWISFDKRPNNVMMNIKNAKWMYGRAVKDYL